MKGIVCAGGYGKRLWPMTAVTNKHLLPVYDKPMIFYALQILKDAGITDAIVITGPENAGDFLKLLGSGKNFGIRLTYRVQDEAGGIAQAIGMCRDFVGKDNCFVILGDNIFEDGFAADVKSFDSMTFGAKIFLKRVSDASRFGVAELSGDKIISIEEKPKAPKTDLAVTGAYIYDSTVFDVIATLKPSNRGELEITDVNNHFIQRGRMTYSLLRGYWSDAGTVESLQRASEFVCKKAETNRS